METLEQKFIDSREVAEMVGKQHNELLKDIRRYAEQLGEGKIPQSDFFAESTYVNSQNKKMPCYQVTKKGCEFIAHKLTGVKGTEFTAKYIDRFHEMEDAIKAHIPTGNELIALAVVEAQKLLAQKEEEIKQLEDSVQQMDKVITELTPKADYADRILSSNDCMTVTQIAQDYGLSAVSFNRILSRAGIQGKSANSGFYMQSTKERDMCRSKPMTTKNQTEPLAQSYRPCGRKKADCSCTTV